MRVAIDAWRVLPHGRIRSVTENLWTVDGEIEGGPPIRRVMTVARRRDGRVVIYNGIALDEAGMHELEALGEPVGLVVPSGFHRIDAARFAKRYPSMKVYCPRGGRARVQRVVRVDGTIDEIPSDPDVSLEHAGGTGDQEAVMIVRSPGGTTLVLNDLVFNMPHQGGFGGFVLKHVTKSSGGPRVSRIARVFLIKDASGVRRDLERWANLPDLKRVIVSHHEMIDERPADVLTSLAATI
jgi:hypothetical protein